MDVRLVLFIVVLLSLAVEHRVEADFYFNHITPKRDELEELRLKCVPGRTTIRVEEPTMLAANIDSSGEYEDGRRTHMTHPAKDEHCKVCVCSVEGKDEYCSTRPANNVNECLRMSQLMERFKKGMPFEHERDLAWRIRRDYLWHNDEIPYEAKARCQRGHSYYSNSINANDTDIDVASDIESLLDYNNNETCYYCVCSVHGRDVGCISRSPWFCEYFRVIREDGAARDMYRQKFQQDRPTYFRQLSYRLRRTMDNGIYDLVQTVGTDRPKNCVPFVSEYTDCTDDNKCSGCSKCTCTAKGEWACEEANQCDDVFSRAPVDDNDIDSALLFMESEMKAKEKKEAAASSSPLVPAPPKRDFILEQDEEKKFNIEDEILALMRPKRSVKELNKNDVEHNDTIKFYHTVDEVNEDTLKDENVTGTLQVKKMDAIKLPKISRRTGLLANHNISDSLQIEFSKQPINEHLTDNKIDSINEDKFDEKVHQLISNFSKKEIDRNLSKLIVNEMKKGTELIGDKYAPVMSNITFAPENDTLPAMAFIAGNLLNQLWNMEKDSSDESIETEIMKHEKINDLLELFKEPLTMRQEMFLKNALDQLSRAVDKNKDVTSISLCKNVEATKKSLNITSESNENNSSMKDSKKCDKNTPKQTSITSKTLTNINNVLTLMKKIENIHGQLNNLKFVPKSEQNRSIDLLSSKEDDTYPNHFLGILEKITKLFMPNKKNNKLLNKIRNQHFIGNSEDLLKKLKKMFNIDLRNITATSKDKIVLDYLAHIENNPGCLLNEQSTKKETKSLPSIEGDILLNLSEFFKMKSFADLMHLLGPQKALNLERTSHLRTVEDAVTKIATTSVETSTTKIPINNNPQKIISIKDKLKAHLRTILEDLVEIQKAKGMPIKDTSDIRITDILPCIYNILNAGKVMSVKRDNKEDTFRIITSVFGNLKKELQYTSQTRRTSTNIATQRPKSAVVWERVIKSLNEKQKVNTRRSFNARVSKSPEELKTIIDHIESGSSTYKNDAFLTDVTPAERLLLLKTLEVDIKKYVDVLGNIKITLEDGKITHNNHKDFSEFVDNVAMNINLNGKVLKSLYKPKTRRVFVDTVGYGKETLNKFKSQTKQALRASENSPSFTNMKLTRDQIINQLIKNKIEHYIRIKEAKEMDLSDDINYDIAKKILLYLESGNYNIAREMYKVFVNQKQTYLNNPQNEIIESSISNKKGNLRRQTLEDKEPLIHFETQSVKNNMQMTQDHLIRQLINIKNMRV